jgi:hypothetical protein
MTGKPMRRRSWRGAGVGDSAAAEDRADVLRLRVAGASELRLREDGASASEETLSREEFADRGAGVGVELERRNKRGKVPDPDSDLSGA